MNKFIGYFCDSFDQRLNNHCSNERGMIQPIYQILIVIIIISSDGVK
ncbi:hypothetical protein O185_12215 [Photorhabdus temperata J3]|uniref:Uncharacterized protein n=1 Tax=Photorhabdus temperata J3 TaxID=1389415 RepID=U7R099_PHOTE|nr:hypothetical protein O185_12215 [Photorhabdus temperata J3]